MGEIRKLEESLLPQVAALKLKVFHQRVGVVAPALEEYFKETLLCNPWRNEEISSLAYLHRGKLAGFLGVVPRKMSFEGKPIHVAVTTQLMVDPEAYCGQAAVELLRHLFRGPQALTFTDGSNEASYTVWTAFGGKVARLYSLQWRRVLRNASYLCNLVEGGAKQPGLKAAARIARPACYLADVALARLPFGAVAAPRTQFRSDVVDAEGLLQCIQEIGWREALQPAYESDSFRWLMAQASSATKNGTLRMVVLRDSDNTSTGWYAYWAKRGGISPVLQIGARPPHVPQTLLALMQDAWEQGALALSGQVIPRYMLSMFMKHCAFRYEGNGFLFHSPNTQITQCILQGEAALSRLDGEWWMRFAAETWF